MDEEATPFRPRFLVLACAAALSVFAVSAVVAFKQVRNLGEPALAQDADPQPVSRPAAVAPVASAAAPLVTAAQMAPAPPITAPAYLASVNGSLVEPAPSGPGPDATLGRQDPAQAAAIPAVALAAIHVAGEASAAHSDPPPPTVPVPSRPAASPGRTFRICAGSPTGNYTFAAREIAAQLAALGEAEVVTTAGSGENLRRLAAGECEMGFSQADVLALRTIEQPAQMAGLDAFKRVYGEYVHILCPVAAGWTNAGAFDARTRLILGGEGSGTAETWRAFVRAAPNLAAVQRLNDPVNLVAVNRVKDSRDTCMLWISGLNSGDMQGANRMSANTSDGRRAMRLIAVTQPELRNLRLADGQPIYRFEQIDGRSGAYDNLLDLRSAPPREARRGIPPSAVTVPVVDAVLVVRRDFLASLPSRGSEIVAAVEDAAPRIWARVSPKR